MTVISDSFQSFYLSVNNVSEQFQFHVLKTVTVEYNKPAMRKKVIILVIIYNLQT